MFKKNLNPSKLVEALKEKYSTAYCALNHKNPLELLVATILSAQCTDVRVNKVTPALFKKYRTAKDYADTPQKVLETEVRSTGFYRNKAKSIRGMSRLLVDKYQGQVPQEMDQLLELPGVARKTANVVLGNAFKKSEGVVVDTHVMRLSGRLGLSKETQPEKIERDLMEKIPREEWIWFSHALISHGRSICKARNPACPVCPLRRYCANPVFP